jgi:DNA primase
LPEGEDPDSIFRKGGAHALTAIMAQTTPAVPFLFNAMCATHDRSKPEELSMIVQEVLEVIRPLADPVVKTGHCQWLAQQLNIPENVVLQELKVVDDSHRSAFDNPMPKIIPKALMPNQMPAFRMPQAGEATFQILLELILRFDFLAAELSRNDDVAALIPDTPLGQAINMVVAQTSEGEWELAEQSIINSDLAADPSVGKVLNNPQYGTLLPEAGDEAAVLENKREKVNAAFNDCLNELLRNDLDLKIAAVKQAMNTESGDALVQLQRDFCELIAQKNKLRKR